MGRHIAGNPEIIVQNMPGAGSMIAANHVYNLTKPDGLTLGSIAPGLYYAQLTGRKEVQFDWAKFTWIGSPESNGHLLFMRSDAPYKTLDDIRNAKEPPRCSATGVGTSGHDVPKLFDDALGLKFRIITGYPGGAEQDLALERGEVQCRAITIAAFFSREPFLTWHKKGFVRVMIQTARRRNPKIPEVPTIFDLMEQYKSPESRRRLATVYLGAGGFGSWPIVSSPGTPPDRVKILREIDGIFTNEHRYLLEWYAPFQRIAYLNKFGQPNGYLTRTGDYSDILSLWWIDPEKSQKLEQALRDPSINLGEGQSEDKYWLDFAKVEEKEPVATRGRQ